MGIIYPSIHIYLWIFHIFSYLYLFCTYSDSETLPASPKQRQSGKLYWYLINQNSNLILETLFSRVKAKREKPFDLLSAHNSVSCTSGKAPLPLNNIYRSYFILLRQCWTTSCTYYPAWLIRRVLPVTHYNIMKKGDTEMSSSWHPLSWKIKMPFLLSKL